LQLESEWQSNAAPMNDAPLQPRRKPSQARARITAGAIRDAFAIALVENGGYERVSMRDIASIAGVGLGTLYLYFPNKDSIGAAAVKAWMRRHAQGMKAAMHEAPLATVRERADAMVRACAQEILSHPDRSRALLVLERRLTPPAVYRDVYRQHVRIVAEAFAAAPDWPARCDAQPVASLAFCISEAALRNALLAQDAPPPLAGFTAGIQDAVRAAIGSVLQPAKT
jgi:AcrR family transcriptional regulator